MREVTLRRGFGLLRPYIALACLCGASAAAADPAPLAGDGLKSLVPGTLIEIDTPLNTVLPVRFGTDGLMTGEARELTSVLGAEKDRGRWWVVGDKLCLKWFRWFDAEQQCLTLKQDDNRIYWQEDAGKSGTATIIQRGEMAAKTAPPARSFVSAAVAAPPMPPPATPPVLAPQPGISAAPSPEYGQLTIISRAEAATPPSAAEPADEAAQDAPATIPSQAAAPAAKPPAARAAAKKHPPKLAAKSPAPKKIEKGAAVAALKSNKPAADNRARLEQAPTYQVAGVDADDVLNIRSGPSEYHAAVGVIPPEGRGVKIVGACEQDWCPITHGRFKGWVNRYYLSQETTNLSEKRR